MGTGVIRKGRDYIVALRRLSELAEHLEPQTPEVIKVENASSFVQFMASLEGQLRVAVCKDGCRCKMNVGATGAHPIAGGMVLTVRTMHDAWCPWIVQQRIPQEERRL